MVNEGYSEIIRPATVDERKDFIEVTGRKNNIDRVYDAIAKKKVEYLNKLHKPFCARCAKYDFEDKVEKTIKEGKRIHEDDFEEGKTTIRMDDLDKYADSKRFEFLGENVVYEDKLLDGMRQSSETGKWMNYKCSVRGCGISIFVPKPREEKK